MSVQSEIDRIKGNVADAYSAVAEKGGEVPETQNSGGLAAAILTIPSGGAGPTTPLDPVEVYKATRPADWLPMPEPQDNEMYLLFHIPEGVSSLLAFTVTCTGSYTVALGTVSNGQFVQQSIVPKPSGVKYEAELFASDYGNLTSDGFKQVMIKVSGTDILTWEPSVHSKKTAPSSFSGWNIVEMSCRLPSGTKVACGNQNATLALKKLQYFAWYGENAMIDMSYMFTSCHSLAAVLQLNTQNATTAVGMFFCAYRLLAVPSMDTSNVENMTGMFNKCYSLTTCPHIDTQKVTITSSMFTYCNALVNLPGLDTSKCTNMASMFNGCSALVSVPQLDISKVTSANNMFNGCNSLAKLKLSASLSSVTGADISLKDCSLGHQALVDLFNSLPTISSSKALTLTGNPGVSELTAAEKAIATGKNWTLTL